MGYMVVEKHTPDMLHLKRSPGIRSWSLLVGMGLSFCVFITFAASLFMFNLKELEKTSSNFLLPLCTGIASVGLAAAYYSSGEKCSPECSVTIIKILKWRITSFVHRFMLDSILWKMFYVTGCLFVALQNMEEWEVGRHSSHFSSVLV